MTTTKTINAYKAEKFEQIATKMTSKETFDFVVDIVEVYTNLEMKGEEKFKEVVKIVKPIVISAIPFVAEIVVQLAYFFLKSKLQIEVKQ